MLAAAVLAVGAAPAAAHGGDTTLVHSCIGGDGNVKIIAADESCKKNELPLDWSRDAGAAGPTYSAGSGLELEDGVFSVKDVPWGSLAGIPDGFSDGVDNVGTAPTWETLGGVPEDLRDGDDDGSAAVSTLSTNLAADDGTPDQDDDPVSFSKIKDLTSMSGDGRITGQFVRDGSITASDLAGSDAAGAIVAGAVTSEKILDGTIQARDLASGVLERTVTTMSVDPQAIFGGTRVAVSVPLSGVRPDDIVVVSPPMDLPGGLVFAGSDVLVPGTVTIYLHNITADTIDAGSQTWTVRQLRTG